MLFDVGGARCTEHNLEITSIESVLRMELGMEFEIDFVSLDTMNDAFIIIVVAGLIGSQRIAWIRQIEWK